jgi:ubiquinone biosynthesis protein COQ9
MSDTARDRILLEALREIPAHGFSDATLNLAAERAGVDKRTLKDSFPNGPASLAEACSHWADARMTEAMKADTSERVRDRIRNAVKARIEAVIPYKEAARKAASFLALPQHAPLAAKLMMHSVDAMWRATGDKSSDFSYYTKRAILSGVYGATFLYWLSDSSEGNAATWTFLDKRVENVMQIERFRGAAQQAAAKLPNPLEILAKLRDRVR